MSKWQWQRSIHGLSMSHTTNIKVPHKNQRPQVAKKILMSVSLVLVQKKNNGIGTFLNFNKKLFFSSAY